MHRHLWLLLLLTGLGACDTGSGSRLPPFLPAMPQQFLTGVVHDADGKAVVGAVVDVGGRTAVSRSNGRFLVPDPPTGNLLVTVDGTTGTADGSDQLGAIAARLAVASGRGELDRPLVIPDLLAGASRLLPLGAQATAVTVDGSATSGAILDIAAGTILSRGGATQGQASVTLTRVDAEDLPVVLPSDAAGARLPTRGIWISPLDLGFTVGVRLSVPNDVQLPANERTNLFRLDPVQGTWSAVGVGTVDSGGQRIVMDVADLPGGGLCVFTTSIGQTTTITGRVVNVAAVPVGRASVVTTGGLATRCDGNGLFSLGPLPAVDGANQAVTHEVVIIPPLGFAPVARQRSITASGAVTNAGDTAIDTYRSGLVRFLLALRGREAPLRRTEFGSFGVGGLRLSDSGGLGGFRELPTGWVGAFATWVEGDELFRGFVRDELRLGEDNVDLQVLIRPEEPRPGELQGRLLAIVINEAYAAPLQDAVVQGRNDPTTENRQRTNQFGEAFVRSDRFGESTAAMQTTAQGITVRSAYTLADLDNNRAEFPLRVAPQSRVGAFDDHAVIEGSLLQGAGGTKVRKVYVRPFYRENGFWNRVLTGQDSAGVMPRKLDPEVTGGTAFLLGLPAVRGTVAAVEGITAAGAFVPEKLGFLANLETNEGTYLRQDVVLSHDFVETVRVPGVVSGLDAALAPTLLRYDLGARGQDGSALDLVSEAGGVQVNGADAVISVPARAAGLEGVTWLLALGARGTKSGADVTQVVHATSATDTANAGTFLAIPEITSPRPGTTSGSSSEISVTWTIPPGTDFFELQLESTVGNDVRAWTVVLPGNYDRFPFRRLVNEAPQILASGRTWNLELRAFRLNRGISFGRSDGYQRFIGNVYSLRPGERGVDASSSWRLTFSTP